MSGRHGMRAKLARAAARVLAVALATCVFTHAMAAQAEYPGVVPGYRMSFPRDEGSHPRFRIEWWYLTGLLETEQGAALGIQVTFFRVRPGRDDDNPSRFAARELLFAHAAISDPRRGSLLRAEKSARAGFGLAEARTGALDVHIDQWRLSKQGQVYRASITGSELALELECVALEAPLLHGHEGFSRKGPQPASASYYYSEPQLRSSGRVVIDGREQRVRGIAWFDHEWSDRVLDEAAHGWDWTGLNLDDGSALMAFRTRDARARHYWSAATLRAPGGPAEPYAPEEVRWEPLRYWRSPRTGINYPVEWRLMIGQRRIVLRPVADDQENDARGSTGVIYWEGAVRAFDEKNRQIGRGYLELTGYGARMAL